MSTFSRCPRPSRAVIALASAALVSLTGAPPGGWVREACAEPTDAQVAAARQIWKEGKELEAKNDWAGALERFKRVAEVKKTPQVRYEIAHCEENLGRLVSALNGFERATEDARTAGAEGADVLARAPARAQALRERLPKLKLVATGEVRVSRVLLDGSPVAVALLGTDMPVDLGAHEVVVERRGTVLQREKLTLGEREQAEITLTVDDKGVPDEEPKVEPPKPVVRRARAFEMTPTRIPSVVVVSLGLGSLVGSGALWGLREQTIVDLVGACPTQLDCDPGLQGLAADGQTFTTASLALLGVGSALTVGGAALFFALPGSVTEAPKRGSITPSWVMPFVSPTKGGFSLGVSGAF